MRSRYCAFKLKLSKYIIDTTHKNNNDFGLDTKRWEKDILDFCDNCNFNKLEILEFIDGESDSFVTFRATIFCNLEDNSFTERSKFVKESDKWYYLSGVF